MSTTGLDVDPRAARFTWSIRAASWLALIAGVLQVVLVLVGIAGIPQQLTGNPVTVTIDTAQQLHSVGRNSYGGGAYVADGAEVTVTGVQAQVRDLDASVRVGLAFGPVAWALTGAAVALLLADAFRRLARSPAEEDRAARDLVRVAVVTAVGTSVGQLLDDLTRSGLQRIMWHGPQGWAMIGSGVDTWTFQFGWLAASVGVLAIAVVVARSREPQR